MEDLSKILHNLDQGNTNVTDAKKLVLDLFLVMLSDLKEEGETIKDILDRADVVVYKKESNDNQNFLDGIKYVIEEIKQRINT